MLTKSRSGAWRARQSAGLAVVLLAASACSRPAPTTSLLKKIPAGSQEAGFLSSYAKLTPNPRFENTRSFVSQDAMKNVHSYVAMIVEPTVVYVATDADEKKIPEKGVASLTEYFHQVITDAVESAYPVVQSPGPLVLRLRTAIVGVDVGSETPAADRSEKSLERALNIGKVGVEMEVVDSETGDQIAAVVDRENLGDGAEVGSAAFTREEKFRAATQAFDGWAHRLRAFLDAANERSEEDGKRIAETNFPYSEPSAPHKFK